MRYGMAALLAVVALGACSDKNDTAEDRMEQAAEKSAAAAGPAQVALGLSEAQLLGADLIGPGNTELGDVARIERNAAGEVDRLLVEIEDSNPDRFVHIPVSGLKPIVRGADTDLQTTMTIEALRALPEVKLTPP